MCLGPRRGLSVCVQTFQIPDCAHGDEWALISGNTTIMQACSYVMCMIFADGTHLQLVAFDIFWMLSGRLHSYMKRASHI